MKQLSDDDILSMLDEPLNFDNDGIRKQVRAELKLSRRILPEKESIPNHKTLDLHQHTEEQAWQEIMELAQSGIRNATIITGASGILHNKFPQWASESILSPYISSYSPINNGSFCVKFKKSSH